MSHALIKIVDGIGITDDDPWTTDEQEKTTTSGNSSTEVARISIPDDEISVVVVEISVQGEDSDGQYGGYYEEKIKVWKENGSIKRVKILEAIDSVGLNLQADFGKSIELKVSGNNINEYQQVFVNGKKAQIELYKDSDLDSRFRSKLNTSKLAQAISGIEDPTVKANLSEAARNHPIIQNAKANVGFDFDNNRAAEISVGSSVNPKRGINRKTESGDLVYESENLKNYGIQRNHTEINSEKAAISRSSSGVSLLTIPDDKSLKPHLSTEPDFQQEKISDQAPHSASRYVIDLVTDSSGVQHALWTDSTAIWHANNAGGSWSEEKVVDWSVASEINASIDDNDTIHIIAAEGVEPDKDQYGNIRYFYGTTGSWTDFGRVGSSLTGRAPDTSINNNGDLGIIVTNSGGDLSFNRYDGTFSGWETVTTEDQNVHRITWQNSKWHISHQKRGVNCYYSFGMSGSWDIDNVIFQNGTGFVPVIKNIGGGSLLYLRGASITHTSSFAFGTNGNFDKRNLTNRSGGIRMSSGPDGKVSFVISGGNGFCTIITMGEPREVDYEWKTVSKVKHVD